jgi:hypothetical protein
MTSNWWWLDLSADYPELEIYHGGWKADQERDLLELGDRVLIAEADWMLTWIYSTLRDRIWAAVSYYVRAMRTRGTVPPEWLPDVDTWDSGV